MSQPPLTPCCFIQTGTLGSIMAAQITWVAPKRTRTEPVAWGAMPAVKSTGRSWSGRRPSARARGCHDSAPSSPGSALLALDRLDAGRRLGALRRHRGDQPVVEILGRVVPDPLQGLGQRGDLHKPRHVRPGPHVELDVGDLHVEDRVVVLLEAGALLDRVRRPFPQRHDHVDPLLQPDRLHAEHLRDVDDADSPALHVAPVERPARGHQFPLVERA